MQLTSYDLAISQAVEPSLNDARIAGGRGSYHDHALLVQAGNAGGTFRSYPFTST